MSVSAWVWQFDTDGDPAFVRHVAADRNMRVIVKTHDGLNWMSKWDSSPKAVSGPEQVGVLRDYFGKAGVAFDAWCVPTGVDAVAERGDLWAEAMARPNSLSRLTQMAE